MSANNGSYAPVSRDQERSYPVRVGGPALLSPEVQDLVISFHQHE